MFLSVVAPEPWHGLLLEVMSSWSRQSKRRGWADHHSRCCQGDSCPGRAVEVPLCLIWKRPQCSCSLGRGAVGAGRLCSSKCQLTRMVCAILWRLPGKQAVSSSKKAGIFIFPELFPLYSTSDHEQGAAPKTELSAT